VGAREALALLGTCKDARGVGGAASLDAVRAVSCFNDYPRPPRVVPQVYGLQCRITRLGIGLVEFDQKDWFLESAVSVATKGASAFLRNTDYPQTSADPGAIVSRFPNVISMRLDARDWRIACLEGAMAPCNLEVLDLQHIQMERADETLRSVLAVLPNLRVLLLGKKRNGDLGCASYFSGMTGGDLSQPGSPLIFTSAAYQATRV
jgi:hypothetical protein